MKKLLLIALLISSTFAMELNFKKTLLDEFEIQGFSEKVIYKNKVDRDLQIAKLWERFLSSKEFDIKKSEDKKLYVVYSNYKANSFDCFIGIKSKSHIFDSEIRIVSKSNYLKSVLKYERSMDMSDIWDKMQEQKLARDFKADIEQYDLMDLNKNSYFINIYLSMK